MSVLFFNDLRIMKLYEYYFLLETFCDTGSLWTKRIVTLTRQKHDFVNLIF